MAGVYIHIPFCHCKCAYCDFYSVAQGRRLNEQIWQTFANAVRAEYEARADETADLPIKTIYIGGGTPSLLPTEYIDIAIGGIPKETVEEFTIEVNPEDVNADIAYKWHEIGINRISMGVQSCVDSELRAIGRRHSAATALNAVKILREAGFDNISLDLIYGLPEQTLETFEYSLNAVLSLGVEHVSAYILSYEPGTALTRRLERGRLKETSEETILEMYSLLCHRMSDFGLEHYEISNFAKPGRRSVHNSAYWDLTPYIGLGPAAHSLDAKGIRRYHEPGLNTYLSSPTDLVVEEESRSNRLNDLLIISLRRKEGIDMEMLSSEEQCHIMSAAQANLVSGALKVVGRHLVVPEAHWLETDAILRQILFD